MTIEKLPFWLVNIPTDEWPTECPDYLVNTNAKDREILSTRDEDFQRHTWQEVRTIIKAETNRIDLLRRAPIDLRRYLEYMAKLVRDYGSVMNFVLKERLQWTDLTPRGEAPFSDAADIKILYNDWPYGVDGKIVHLVVWTKFDLEDDPSTDDLTLKARKEINDFVNKTFCARADPENVIWFKNWRSLKSIHAVEHFHVMLFDPDMEFIREVTGNDMPMMAKLK
ncbi:hypothetical protein FGG08_002105 [Glutinoglossum americanum]|uniref:N-acetylglucosamine-induced protein 1 n=1 Tax=Glutinoglossum americanum TaxID=1670608 RepID=A0A9P8I9W9_9PEZI|nr:hypothetical protein FGG08_002105 [Glutinoglossum americanum]